MDLRRLVNVAYVALMGILDEEQRADWHAETEQDAGSSAKEGPKRPERKPENRGVRALMAIAKTMPRG